MLSRRPPRRFVAWLAIVTLWLTIVAPVVSQTLASPLDALVSIGWCGPHHDDGTQSPPAGHLLEKCGYCGLLCGHSLLPPIDGAPAVPRSATAQILPLAGQPRRPGLRALATSPRGPPAAV